MMQSMGSQRAERLSNNSRVHRGIFEMDDQEDPTVQPRRSVQSSMAAWTGGEFEGEWTHVYV